MQNPAAPSAPVALAVVLCAGQGTRMKSALPKVLHPLLGQPMCAWPLSSAQALGATRTVAVVGHGADQVESAVQSAFGDDVQCVLQAERKGTGHAVMVAMDALADAAIEGTVLVLYGDTPLLKTESLAALVDARGDLPLAMLTTTVDDPTGYGRIVKNVTGDVVAIVEHKDASPAELEICEVNPGIYAVDAGFLRRALPELKNENAQGEYYLTDLVAMAAAAGGVATLEVPAADTYGVNDRVQLARAAGILRARINEGHLRAGVAMEDPDATYIGPHVTIGQDVSLAAGVHLRGTTTVQTGARIDVGAVITDSHVGPDVTIKPYSVLEDARVDAAADVGPFGRLRPGAHLEEGARIGNFVEVKKSTLKAGAKVNHLAYIGDATVGQKANVGAGTITCNYDGANKHPTAIGDGAFIGSNSTLVAPVTIGDGAYVAAGSTVTKAVPDDALAFGRPKQANKAGYAARLRARIAAEKAKAADGK